MRSRTSVVLIMALALVMASAAWAQSSSATASGKVVSIDAQAGTMTVDTPTGMVTFRTDSQTMLRSQGDSIRLSEVRVGDRVTITYTGDADNRLASHIDLKPASEMTASAENLPRTASTLPLVGLAGILLVGAALLVKVATRH